MRTQGLRAAMHLLLKSPLVLSESLKSSRLEQVQTTLCQGGLHACSSEQVLYVRSNLAEQHFWQ